jgi:protein-S-isoprenylcysteine O-methyltransferase Ste14
MAFAVGPRSLSALDWFERLAIAALFSAVVWSMWSTGRRDAFFWLYCASEGLVVLFVLIRRPAGALTLRLSDWLLAVTATALPMLVRGGATPLIWTDAAMALVLAGIAIQLSAKLILRRSFGVVAANRGVKQSGPYMFVRHPMYAGYLVTHVGMLMLSPLAWNASLYALAWAVQIARLLAEERLLNQDATYQAYAQRVRYRLIPGVF